MRCLGRLLMLVLLLVGAGAAWLYRGRIEQKLREVTGRETQVEAPSAELAAQAQGKIERLRAGSESRVALSGVELESLLRHRHAGLLPGFIGDPQIEIDDDRLRLRSRVPTERLPSLDFLGAAADFLPDTAAVEIVGRLLPLDERRAAFAVDGLQLAEVPIPDRVVPGLLERLGRTEEPGLPADALAVPLPPGTRAVYVRGDSLVLVAAAGGSS